MPRERRHHNKLRRFLRHHRDLVFVAVATLIVLAAVAGLIYFLTSSNFVSSERGR